jgi:hypothetical protein
LSISSLGRSLRLTGVPVN